MGLLRPRRRRTGHLHIYLLSIAKSTGPTIPFRAENMIAAKPIPLTTFSPTIQQRLIRGGFFFFGGPTSGAWMEVDPESLRDALNPCRMPERPTRAERV